MVDLVNLRSLPKVKQVEAMCRGRRAFDPSNLRRTSEFIDAVSISLFGITREDTIWYEGDEWVGEPDEGPSTPEEYELCFAATRAAWSEARPFWEAIGWDLTSEKGHPLHCCWVFERQIIACVRELVEGAIFTPDGSGRWGGETDEYLEARRLKAWEDALQEDAARFLLGRGE